MPSTPELRRSTVNFSCLLSKGPSETHYDLQQRGSTVSSSQPHSKRAFRMPLQTYLNETPYDLHILSSEGMPSRQQQVFAYLEMVWHLKQKHLKRDMMLSMTSRWCHRRNREESVTMDTLSNIHPRCQAVQRQCKLMKQLAQGDTVWRQ